MKKGALPIPHVIALILGVALIALLGYLFISQSSKTIKGGTDTECQAKLFQYCVAWTRNNCEGDGPTNILEGCSIASTVNECQKLGFCK